MLNVLRILQDAGSDFIVIPSNTPYLFYDEIASSVSIPVLHIVEETANAVSERNVRRVGIIPNHPEVGELYRKCLDRYELEAETPEHSSYKVLTAMTEEFMAGRNIDSAKRFFMELMDNFNRTTDVTILACTELPLILGSDLNKYRFVDSTQVLAEATVEYALT